MRWSKTAWVVVAGAALALLPLLRSAEDKKLAIYAPGANYSVAVQERGGGEYVALFDVLEPLGGASARADGTTWRVDFNGISCEFKAPSTKAKIGHHTVELGEPFLLDGKRGYVPLNALPSVLARLMKDRVDFHSTARRLFIGNVGTRFTLELKAEQGLVVSFSRAVNPVISTEPGRLKMTFARDPVVSGTGNFQFADDKLISGAKYIESNGIAELIVQTNAPVLASFADEGKTIRIAAAPTPVAQATPSAAPSASATPPGAATPPPAPTPTTSPGTAVGTAAGALHPAYLVVIDASHGGEERGAALSDTLAEKEVTLAFARKLRSELQNRGIATLMLRDSDATLSLEQRAETANTSRAAVYVTLHAATMVRGVRVYTAMLPASDSKPQMFIPWETAQAGHTAASRVLAESVAEELGKRELPTAIAAAPIRPLNNVVAAAIAVEVTPPGKQVEGLTLSSYQQAVTGAIAEGIASARGKVGAAAGGGH